MQADVIPDCHAQMIGALPAGLAPSGRRCGATDALDGAQAVEIDVEELCSTRPTVDDVARSSATSGPAPRAAAERRAPVHDGRRGQERERWDRERRGCDGRRSHASTPLASMLVDIRWSRLA